MNDSRSERAVRVIARHLTGGHDQRLAQARQIVAELDEEVSWPTQESIASLKAAFRSSTNTEMPMSDLRAASVLREAMLVDPIHRLAVTIARCWQESGRLDMPARPGVVVSAIENLRDFCLDAGLL